jgi:serpin B
LFIGVQVLTTIAFYFLNPDKQGLKGTATMHSILSKRSIKKALVAGVIALIMCSNPALTSRQTEARMVDDRLHAATSRFAFKLYDQIIKQRNGKNTFLSPASVMLALAMTYNGADGTTREAMARALELEGMTLDDVNRAFADLKLALNPQTRSSLCNLCDLCASVVVFS